tara:strand:- start:8 stop:544 length:537 start_codon:yes stop_codon:yes gene_type:complete
MPNAILRVGPFATSSNFFVNAPFSAVASTLPVNCAMNNWETDSWKLMSKKGFSKNSPPFSGESIAYLSGPTVTQSTSSEGPNPGGSVDCAITFEFKTQAAVEFRVKVTATGGTSGGTGDAEFEFSVINETTIEETGTDFSSSRIVTIQPSVSPSLFRAKIEASDAGDAVNATLKVEPA